jgi:hypothetical protein
MNNSETILSNVITEIYSPIYQLVAAISVVYFVYGVARFIIEFNNPEQQTQGRSHLLYGSLGLFIVLSVGAILSYFGEIFNGLFQ